MDAQKGQFDDTISNNDNQDQDRLHDEQNDNDGLYQQRQLQVALWLNESRKWWLIVKYYVYK